MQTVCDVTAVSQNHKKTAVWSVWYGN